MSAKIYSATLIGIKCEIIEVEADLYNSFNPGISIVGLPDKAVEESRERIRASLKNSGMKLPRKRFIVNLAPAHIRKQGPSYDLPIAISLLSASKMIPDFNFSNSVILGELALDGTLNPVHGVLAVATELQANGITELYVPQKNANEASIIQQIKVYPINNLLELVNHIKGIKQIQPRTYKPEEERNISYEYNFAHIKGQEFAKRALEITASGGHNVILNGVPGAGKTLLARSITSILPPLSFAESIEVTKLYSVAKLLPKDTPIITKRPFRNPHHTSSGVSLVGGGTWPKPGQISLAHRGVLFLDELPEFPRTVLENLRQPLEDAVITICRASHSVEYPARFILIGAMNPCPCGYLSDTEKDCTCSQTQIQRYAKKISGPLLDRIDLYINVERVETQKLIDTQQAEASAIIRKRVISARKKQQTRYQDYDFFTNAEIPARLMQKICPLSNETKQFMTNAIKIFKLSARSFTRTIRVARTIADLTNREDIQTEHIAEALQYRQISE